MMMMSQAIRPSLSESVRKSLHDFIQANKESHTALDVLRTFQQEALLQFETEQVKDLLLQDPFEHFQDIQDGIQRLLQLIRVTDSHRVLTKTGYSYIEATVRLHADDILLTNGVVSHLELVFQYERTQSNHEPASVWYSINLNRDNGPNERLLWVQVMAAGSTPSHLPAVNMDQDDDDEWEDMDAEENADDDEEARMQHDEKRDRYVAGMDPEVLSRFLQWTQLGPMDEATVFFLLMTFPFYEHEFDIVGLVLEAVFGFDNDDSHSGTDQSMNEDGNDDSDGDSL